jgi:hypothetical protein
MPSERTMRRSNHDPENRKSRKILKIHGNAKNPSKSGNSRNVREFDEIQGILGKSRKIKEFQETRGNTR